MVQANNRKKMSKPKKNSKFGGMTAKDASDALKKKKRRIDNVLLNLVQESGYSRIWEYIDSVLEKGISDEKEAEKAMMDLGIKPWNQTSQRKILFHKAQLQIAQSSKMTNETTFFGRLTQAKESNKDPDRFSCVLMSEVKSESVKLWFLSQEKLDVELMKDSFYIVSCVPYNVERQDGNIFCMSTNVRTIYKVPDLVVNYLREKYEGMERKGERKGGSCPYCGGEIIAKSPSYMYCESCS